MTAPKLRDYHAAMLNAENTREKGEVGFSLNLFREVYTQARAEHNANVMAQAIAQILLTLERLYSQTNDRHERNHYLADMQAWIRTGMELSGLEINECAAIWLRRGKYHQLLNYYAQAEADTFKAYEMIKDQSGHQPPEFLGHLAEAKLRNGKGAEALSLLEKALHDIQAVPIGDNPNQVRGFHKKIITAGLLMRAAKTAKHRHRYLRAAQYFWDGLKIASDLNDHYNMPLMLEKYRKEAPLLLRNLL